MPLLRASCGFDSRWGCQKVLDFQGLFDFSVRKTNFVGAHLDKIEPASFLPENSIFASFAC